MALLVKRVTTDDLDVTIYDFEAIGDELAVHSHEADANHNTVVARGSIECLGDPAIAGVIHHSGAYVTWPVGQEHGFRALESNTRIVNTVTRMARNNGA